MNQPVVADIVTVSDRGYEAENPLESFTGELRRLRRKYGLNRGSFSWKIHVCLKGPTAQQKNEIEAAPQG